MTWKKATPELIEAFHAALPTDARVERRKMFGYPCAFVNGNMFTGLHETNLIVRLPEVKRRLLIEERGARVFEPMPGRVMREYVALSEETINDPAELARWMRASFEFAAALAPKPKKQRPKAPAASNRKGK